MNETLPLGKLPPDLLAQLLAQDPAAVADPQIVLGPGVGLDCAVIDNGGANLLVYKSDPITFATEEIGWYLVQVSCNDIATTGALPRWLLITLLLPEGKTTPALVRAISEQIHAACRPLNIGVIGGHSEITYGLDRPIVVGTLIGEVARERLVTPQGASPGDLLLLTKGVPIEATAILAREFPDRLRSLLTPAELAQAQAFLIEPGISVLRDAQTALAAGRVTAMHDPTEGGLAAALWELAQASKRSLTFDPAAVPVPPLADRICRAFQLNPLATIASGALLLATPAADAPHICQALDAVQIPCVVIGQVEAGPAAVWQQTAAGRRPLLWPERDEITRVYEAK
jgi:hydrogenase expression/formation protein HypE